MKNSKMRISLISDTHNKHKPVEYQLPGGDLLLHAGDITGGGTRDEVRAFLSWYHKLEGYQNKIFIAGNHDFFFDRNWGASTAIGKARHERRVERILSEGKVEDDLKEYPGAIYLHDSLVEINGVKIWGSPYTPWFHDWAFNLKRHSEELIDKWNEIPDDVDIVITHGPPYGILDYAIHGNEHVGCEVLLRRLNEIKPKIHVFGHIHEGWGYKTNGDTHFINASVLDEVYVFNHKPFNIEWDPATNELEFLDF